MSKPLHNKGIKGRTFERSQGCWNCISFDVGEKCQKRWGELRQRDLNQASMFAAIDPRGDATPKVVQIRKMVAEADDGIKAGKFGICLAGGAKSDFVQNAYLCNKWNGRVGSSLTRSAGAPLDPLPAELKDKVDGSE